jgi:hypothetical protein
MSYESGDFTVSLALVRVLFPRWNFFDRVGYQLVLDVKQTGGNSWLPLAFNASRSMGGLFINPEVTRLHAEMTTLENFVQDVQPLIDHEGKVDSKRVKALTSFKMVRSMVLKRLMVSRADQVQFRVSAKSGDEIVVIYVSDVLAGTP